MQSSSLSRVECDRRVTEARHPVYLSKGVDLEVRFPDEHLECNVLDATPQALDNLQEFNTEGSVGAQP